MSDASAESGRTDEKGHWRPDGPCEYRNPLFKVPWRPLEVLKWLFGWGGFLWPRHVSYTALAIGTWYLLKWDFLAARELSVAWIALMLARNLIMLWAVFGFYHLTLYILKVQGSDRKYHPGWQEKGKKKFLFRNQVLDNVFLSCVSGAPIWTAYEVLYIWAQNSGRIPLIDWYSNPVWFFVLFLIIPFWRETHFYFVHRLLHWKPLLRAVHSTHHRNPNPAPWSGMSMHPIEHIGYLSVVLIHFIVPSHPIHLFYNAQLTALTPAQSHTGFHGPLFNGRWPVGDYFHYLHHKHVSCNFGVPSIPWDRWLGRFYDGEGQYKTRSGS